MIVALVSLLTALFLGGPAQIFYVDNLEKGIKKNVPDKDRKKEILSDIKSTKNLNKEFEKARKKDYKAFLDLYTDKHTTVEELNSFFNELQETRTTYQNKFLDQRLIIFGKIESAEWDNILESSLTVAEKNMAKAEKKASKSKEDFGKTKSKIESMIQNAEQKQSLLKDLENVVNSKKSLESIVNSINTSQNEILANKHSSKEEILGLFADDNEQRSGLLRSLVNFHEVTSGNCSDKEWAQLMKSFSKEMQMSSR